MAPQPHRRILHTLVLLTFLLPGVSRAATSVGALDPAAPLVVVNGVPITKGDHQRAVATVLKLLHSQGHTAEDLDGAAKSQVLRQLVQDELLFQASRTSDIGDIAARADALLQQFRDSFADTTAYRSALETDGLDEQELQQHFAKRAAVAAYIDAEITPRVTVTDAQIRLAYEENTDRLVAPEQVHLRQILFTVEDSADAAQRATVREQAAAVRDQALAGADFAQLARAHSACPSRERGGDLGWLNRGQLSEGIAEATADLTPGKIGKLAETPSGYHVVLLEEYHPAHPLAFAEVAEALRTQLLARARKAAVASHAALLGAAAHIEVPAPRHKESAAR